METAILPKGLGLLPYATESKQVTRPAKIEEDEEKKKKKKESNIAF